MLVCRYCNTEIEHFECSCEAFQQNKWKQINKKIETARKISIGNKIRNMEKKKQKNNERKTKTL